MSEQALTTVNQTANQAVDFSAFGNIQHFEQAQRMAKALGSSEIVPINYRGDANIGSCLIALELSNRIGASVLAVMQNLYVVHGKPGWSSQFLISCVNASRKFTPLRYRMTGEKDTDSWGCVAWAKDMTGEVLESPEVTIAMAKAEGWYNKNGSKWKTMPELMLRYRTATLFARLYAPELTMGIQTAEEINDFVDVEATVVTDGPTFTPKQPEPAKAATEKAQTPPTPRARGPRNHDTSRVAAPAPAPAAAPAAATEPEPTQPKQPELSQPAQEPPPPVQNRQPAPIAPATSPAPKTPTAALDDLRAAMAEEGITDDQILAFARTKGLLKDTADPDLPVLSDILGSKVATLAKVIRAKGQSLKEIKGEV